jgi:ATP-dependent RNA helicase DeaD
MAVENITEVSAGFAGLGLDPRLVDALAALGYEEPTPIQLEAIPPLLDGRDLVGQAATGTGKTAAFALPLLQRLARRGTERSQPSILILVPTRELALQVSEAVHRYGRALNVSLLPIYGGQSFAQQLRVLRRGVDVVVATPGRALDHIKRSTLELDGLDAVVLDEADEMLDMGFAEDLEAILAATPATRQTVLLSATIPPRIAAIAKRHLRDPVQIRVARERLQAGAVPRVRQTAYIVARAHKPTALGRVLDMENPEAALVFCRTRNEVDELTETLNAHGHRAEALHGGMSQEQRERVMKKLRRRSPHRDRCRGTWTRHHPAHSRHQLRRPERAGVVRASHWTRRQSRARGCGGNSRRAARAPPAAQYRAAHQTEDRRRQGAYGRRPARPSARARPRFAA